MNDSSTSTRIKKDILKNENEKKNRTYDSDFSDYSRKDTKKNNNINKNNYKSDSESSNSSPVRKPVKKTRSPSPSRSRSSSRTRSNYSDDDKYKSNKKDQGVGRGRSYSPSASTNSRSTIKKKSSSTQPPKRSNGNDYNKSSKHTSKSSRPSAGSLPAPLNDKIRKKNAYNTKLKAQSYQTSSVDQLNNKASQLISAQRIKNNDLQNRISELNIEIEKLREENRTIKRVHRREEAALKKLESQDVDVTKIVKGYQDEINSLKQNIRKMHSDNRKLSNNLLEKEDDLRVLKKKYAELKEILNDKKLIDSAELSKKLDISEQELSDQRSKCQNLERRLELNEKNHKHEIGVEIAHHKETQKQLHKLNEEVKELRVKLEEKDRALDTMNIYSRPNRESNPPPIPLWKTSTTSLNAVAQDSPHDKRKEYDRKVKEKKNKSKSKDDDTHQTTLKLDSERDKTKLDSERDKTKLDSDRRENLRASQNFKQSNSQRDEDEDNRKRIEMERRKLEEEEAELKRKDAAERLKREQKEKEEKDRIEKLRKEAAELEERKRKQQLEKEKEEEQRRLKEKGILEEMERKKRWVNSDIDDDSSENKKKNDLLAKLFSTNDDPVPIPQPVVKKNIFDSTITTSTNNSNNNKPSTFNFNNNNNNNNNNNKIDTHNNNSNSVLSFNSNSSSNKNSDSYKFPRKIENLHEGKPSNSTRNDDNNKNDLLDKLFGSSSNNDKSSNFLQNKLDQLDDYPDGKSKQQQQNKTTNGLSNNKTTQNSSKVPFLPWDLPDAQTGTPPSNQKRNNDLFVQTGGGGGSSTLKTNNSIRRPRETNTIFTSNKINTNSNNFIEDIEELTL